MHTRSEEDYKNIVFSKTGFTFKGVQYNYGTKINKTFPIIVRLILNLQDAHQLWGHLKASKLKSSDHLEIFHAVSNANEGEEQQNLAVSAIGALVRSMHVGDIFESLTRGFQHELSNKKSDARRFLHLVLDNLELAHYLSSLKASEFRKTLFLLKQYPMLVPSFEISIGPRITEEQFEKLNFIQSRDAPKLQFDYETGKVVPVKV